MEFITEKMAKLEEENKMLNQKIEHLKNRIDVPSLENFPEVEHIHHFGWYIGNYPDLDSKKIDDLGEILDTVV